LEDDLLYVLKTGCQWRPLPGDFPPWKTVHEHSRVLRDRCVLDRGAMGTSTTAALAQKQQGGTGR
jgi:transposase